MDAKFNNVFAQVFGGSKGIPQFIVVSDNGTIESIPLDRVVDVHGEPNTNGSTEGYIYLEYAQYPDRRDQMSLKTITRESLEIQLEVIKISACLSKGIPFIFVTGGYPKEKEITEAFDAANSPCAGVKFSSRGQD